MRQRKVKNLDEKLEAVSRWLVEEPSPEAWARIFDQAAEGEATSGGSPTLFLEIGCGKGDFLLQQALAHPESRYIGIEGQASVVLRAAEKAERIRSGRIEEDDPDWMRQGSAEQSAQGALDNVRFACAFVNSMEELFLPGSLTGIYLNFSDPWPKERHAKRRLTYRGRLQDYARALKPGGRIEIKTDNDALFEFTLEEIAACGWTPLALSRDLHGTDEGGTEAEPEAIHRARKFTTEYERKFHNAGKTINYVCVVI